MEINTYKPPKCCKRMMEFKAFQGFLSGIVMRDDVYIFQCGKCKKIRQMSTSDMNMEELGVVKQ